MDREKEKGEIMQGIKNLLQFAFEMLPFMVVIVPAVWGVAIITKDLLLVLAKIVLWTLGG